MNLPTIIIAAAVAAAFVAVLISEIKKRRAGVSSCSCGGNCGSCGGCCHSQK